MKNSTCCVIIAVALAGFRIVFAGESSLTTATGGKKNGGKATNGGTVSGGAEAKKVEDPSSMSVSKDLSNTIDGEQRYYGDTQEHDETYLEALRSFPSSPYLNSGFPPNELINVIIEENMLKTYNEIKAQRGSSDNKGGSTDNKGNNILPGNNILVTGAGTSTFTRDYIQKACDILDNGNIVNVDFSNIALLTMLKSYYDLQRPVKNRKPSYDDTTIFRGQKKKENHQHFDIQVNITALRKDTKTTIELMTEEESPKKFFAVKKTWVPVIDENDKTLKEIEKWVNGHKDRTNKESQFVTDKHNESLLVGGFQAKIICKDGAPEKKFNLVYVNEDIRQAFDLSLPPNIADPNHSNLDHSNLVVEETMVTKFDPHGIFYGPVHTLKQVEDTKLKNQLKYDLIIDGAIDSIITGNNDRNVDSAKFDVRAAFDKLAYHLVKENTTGNTGRNGGDSSGSTSGSVESSNSNNTSTGRVLYVTHAANRSIPEGLDVDKNDHDNDPSIQIEPGNIREDFIRIHDGDDIKEKTYKTTDRDDGAHGIRLHPLNSQITSTSSTTTSSKRLELTRYVLDFSKCYTILGHSIAPSLHRQVTNTQSGTQSGDDGRDIYKNIYKNLAAVLASRVLSFTQVYIKAHQYKLKSENTYVDSDITLNRPQLKTPLKGIEVNRPNDVNLVACRLPYEENTVSKELSPNDLINLAMDPTTTLPQKVDTIAEAIKTSRFRSPYAIFELKPEKAKEYDCYITDETI